MVYIDSDNALGSRFGDTDDAFALCALMASHIPIVGIGAVSGNTSAEEAFSNNQRMGSLMGYPGPFLRQDDAPRFLSSLSMPYSVVALGPLTNLVAAAQSRGHLVREMIVVGSNSVSNGSVPPLWPYEFNLVKDRAATVSVFNSEVPLTVIPLNVARKLSITFDDVKCLQGEMGTYLADKSKRWFTRSRLLKWRKYVPIWDLVAAIYAIFPEMFRVKEERVTVHSSAWIEYRSGKRPVKVVCDFDKREVWTAFERLLAGMG